MKHLRWHSLWTAPNVEQSPKLLSTNLVVNISSKIYYIVFTKLFIIFSGVGDIQHHFQIPDGFLRKIIQILTILITDSHIWSCNLASSWIMILRLHQKTVSWLFFNWINDTCSYGTYLPTQIEKKLHVRMTGVNSLHTHI